MKNKLHIDIETYSSIDIKTSGAYKYTESIDFEILLVAFALNDEPIQIIDLAQGEKLPDFFWLNFKSSEVLKCAHNATFERLCFKAYGHDIPIEQWQCSMVHAAYCGFPLSLEKVSEAMDLKEKGKLTTGRKLIRYFCNPCKPSKTNDQRTRNLPEHDIDAWNEFKEYCINDVEAERAIENNLSCYPIPKIEKINYIIDQEINDTGVLIDTRLAQNAIDFNIKFSEQIKQKVKDITGLDNPNSPAQLKKWLSDALEKEIKSLNKDEIPKLLKSLEPGPVRDVIKFRKKLAKSSVKKYDKMLNSARSSNRSHGLFQFYGANRTGRWAGRLVQLQNLPRNYIKDLAEARAVVASGDYDLATLLFDNLSNILSELIRTAFVAPEGHTLCVADFSAIEARVIAWLAGESWRLEVFRTHGKIYEASASKMFNIPIEKVTKGSDWRHRGKVAELSLGYQGSVGAMKKMGGDKLNMPDETIKELVNQWRTANPSIVKLWHGIENQAKKAIRTGKPTQYSFVTFNYDGYTLRIKLPSGRELFYQKPHFTKNKWDRPSIAFFGIDQAIKKWVPIETYGGKLVENIVQGIARDLLAHSILKLRQQNKKIIMHVHDEIIIEELIENAKNTLSLMTQIMSTEVPWAPGLPLGADGYITPFYKKD